MPGSLFRACHFRGVFPMLRILTNFPTLCSTFPLVKNHYILKLTLETVQSRGEFKHVTYTLVFMFIRRQNGNHSCQDLFFSYSDANDLSLLMSQKKKKKPVHFSPFKHYKMSFLKVLGYKQLIYMNYIFPSALRNNIHLFPY